MREAEAGLMEEADRQIPALADYCNGCRERRPADQWVLTNAELADTHGRSLCRSCRDKGIPPEDPLVPFSPKLRRVLLDYYETGDAMATARKHGLSASHLIAILSGKRHPHVRRAFQRLLEVHGIDTFSIVRKMGQLMESQRAQFNPETREFEFFPDNHAQLGTVRHATKLLDLEPPKEAPSAGPTAIVFQTNIFDDAGPGERPGTIEVSAAPHSAEDS